MKRNKIIIYLLFVMALLIIALPLDLTPFVSPVFKLVSKPFLN